MSMDGLKKVLASLYVFMRLRDLLHRTKKPGRRFLHEHGLPCPSCGVSLAGCTNSSVATPLRIPEICSIRHFCACSQQEELNFAELQQLPHRTPVFKYRNHSIECESWHAPPHLTYQDQHQADISHHQGLQRKVQNRF